MDTIYYLSLPKKFVQERSWVCWHQMMILSIQNALFENYFCIFKGRRRTHSPILLKNQQHFRAEVFLYIFDFFLTRKSATNQFLPISIRLLPGSIDVQSVLNPRTNVISKEDDMNDAFIFNVSTQVNIGSVVNVPPFSLSQQTGCQPILSSINSYVKFCMVFQLGVSLFLSLCTGRL